MEFFFQSMGEVSVPVDHIDGVRSREGKSPRAVNLDIDWRWMGS